MQEFKLKVMDRREVVRRLEQLLGIYAKFMSGQGFRYRIGAYTVTRDNILIAPDDAFEDVLQTLVNENLIERLQAAVPESEAAPTESVPEPDEFVAVEEEYPKPAADTEPVLILPFTGHNGLTLRNLVHLFYTRASLIGKATGAHFYVSDAIIEALKDDACTYSMGNFLNVINENSNGLCGISFTDDSILITAMPNNSDQKHMNAFHELITLMNQSAIEHKRILAKKINEDNEKFAMRIWLDGIGLKGADYKQSRKLLMKPLHGIAAFKTQEQLDIAVAKYRKERMRA